MKRLIALIAALGVAAALLILAAVGQADGATRSPAGIAATPTVSARSLGR